MPNKNSTITYRWMELVWNSANENAIDELMDKECVVHGLDQVKEKGPSGFKVFYHDFREQFPTIHVDVEDTVTEDDFESSRCQVTCTDANGKSVTFAGMTFTKFKDGKIVESWNNFDFLNMYQQLGFALTAPLAADGIR